MGLASAGWAARAQDASTLFKNPAGMSLLPAKQFQGGAQLLYGDVGFKPNGSTSVAGNGGGNPIDVLPGVSAFYTHQLSPDLHVGVGSFSNFGLSLKYDPSWVGRYYTQESTLVGLTVMPAVSYRVKEWLSVGAGMNAMYGYVKQVTAVNNIDPGFGDGSLRYQDGAWGFGANAGILIEPMKGTRLGVTYRSEMKLNFSAGTNFTGLGPGLQAIVNAAGLNRPLDIGITAPQAVMVSAFHQLTDRLAIMGDFGWEQWSRFGQVDISLASTTARSLTTNIPYNDVYHVAIGGQFRTSEAWLVSGGFAYDSSMVDDANRSVIAPVAATYRFGAGAQWQASRTLNVGFAYELAYNGNFSVDQNAGPLKGRVAGEYNSALHFFTLNLSWKSL